MKQKNMTDKYCGVHKIIQYIYSICLILWIINDYECDEVLKGASKEWHNCKNFRILADQHRDLILYNCVYCDNT